MCALLMLVDQHCVVSGEEQDQVAHEKPFLELVEHRNPRSKVFNFHQIRAQWIPKLLNILELIFGFR